MMKLVALLLITAAALAAAGCGRGGEGKPERASSALGGDAPISKAASMQTSLPVTGQGITVVGNGSASVVPDVADWSFGVRSDAATASQALAANARAMNAVIDALRRAGIAKEDLRTDEISLYPQTADDGRTVTGDSASSTVTATIRSLGEAGRVVDAAVGAGASDISGPNMRPSDTAAQYRQAVDQAFDDARARAEAIAAKAGVSLGAPIAISEGGAPSPGPLYETGRLAADSISVEPGTQQVTASLTVTFAIGAGA
jgi:uncharacterized protein YggE